MNQSLSPFVPETYFHVYNRGNNGEKLFYSEGNYKYFISKYFDYIKPVADTLCYCLMPNHFHFVIRIKSEQELMAFIKENKKNSNKTYTSEELGLLVSKQFSNLFNGYSQAVNKQLNRYGTLFSRPFRRKLIDTDEYLKNSILYVHLNPVSHGYTNSLIDWEFCSYNSIVSGISANINAPEVVGLFNDINNFEQVHKLKINGGIDLRLDDE